MTLDLTPSEYTVDELTQLWRDGELSPGDGELHNIDSETATMEIVFEGQDSDLFIEGTVDPWEGKLTFQMKQEADSEVNTHAAG